MEYIISSGIVESGIILNSTDTALILDGGEARDTTINSEGNMYVSSGGVATIATVNSSGYLYVSSGGTANKVKVNSEGYFDILDGGEANSAAVNADGFLYVYSGGLVNDSVINSDGRLDLHGTANNNTVGSGGELWIASDGIANGTTINSTGFLVVRGGGIANNTTVNADSFLDLRAGGTATDTTVNSTGILSVSSGGTANNTTINAEASLDLYRGGTANGTTVNSDGILYVYRSGTANDTVVNSGGLLEVVGTANGVAVNGGEVYVSRGGRLCVSSGNRIDGMLSVENGATVTVEDGAILNFDLTRTEAGSDPFVNNLSLIQGTPIYTLTVDGSQAEGVYSLAEGADGFNSTITVQNTSGESLGTLTVGTTTIIDGTGYRLTNEDSVLSVTVGDAPPELKKWTYLVYMAADNDLCKVALYDIVSMQQARIDPEIEICILVDRPPVDSKDSGDYVTPHGTYKWDSLWPETRVGKISYSPDLTVTVDWEAWGELDTGSIGTLGRFVDWAQEASPAENYGLILWDHGGESAELCWDLTTNPDWKANLTVSEVSGLLQEKDNIPIVIFNNCLLGSELVVTQMAGSTEVIVVSEPMSYSESTFNYNIFFNTITADMNAREMAERMVLNMEPSGRGITTMLSSIDVSVPGLAETLEALAEAVAAADNPADRTVLINAMLKAPQDGCLYDGSEVLQSDLGFLISNAMNDRDYESTSEGFKTALLGVMAALDECVLAFRSIPAGRGSGIAFCNTVCTVEKIAPDSSPKKADATIKSHITSCYKSNPLWGGLLYDFGASYLAENADKLFPSPTFTVRNVDGLVEGRTVSVSDFGCFSGLGERFGGIKLIDDFFFSFTVTAADKSKGRFVTANDADVKVAVSLLASDGTPIATGTDSVSFEDLAPGEYFVRLQSDVNCQVSVVSFAEFMTGVDRFDYAGSGRNEKYANGNGSIAAATLLEKGYYDGLLTYSDDTDYYLIGDRYTERYRIVLRGEPGLTVEEYDGDGVLVRSAEYKDGVYTLTMDSMNYLLVEGFADLEETLNSYSFSVIGLENGSGVVTLDDLFGTKDEVSWSSSTIVTEYLLEFSSDDFGHALQFITAGTAVDLMNLPAGTYQWRVGANQEGAIWYDGNSIVSDNTNDKPKVFQSKADASDDVFFAAPNGTWSGLYCAMHVGSVDDGWGGTGELVSAGGKGRIQDFFFGSADPGTLLLTDSENGDALFLDDAFTGLPEEIEENTARLCRLLSIRAGAGDDIIDMTSRRFEYLGGELTLSGGDGDDVIWAGNGKNNLCGDAGNDRIIGASGDDVIIGGIGDDAMHGGGGDDIFTFCKNWGTDTVEQLEGGSVTLWFINGSMDNWDAANLTYADGDNRVTVSGVSLADITLKFGEDESDLYEALSWKGAFEAFISRTIFEEYEEPETDSGFLAGL